MDRRSRAARKCHREVDCSGLEPDGYELGSGIFEEQGCCEAHKRTHSYDGYYGNGYHQVKGIVSFQINNGKCFFLCKWSNQEEIKNECNWSHDDQLVECIKKYLVVHSSYVESNVVTDHGINHHEHHDKL